MSKALVKTRRGIIQCIPMRINTEVLERRAREQREAEERARIEMELQECERELWGCEKGDPPVVYVEPRPVYRKNPLSDIAAQHAHVLEQFRPGDVPPGSSGSVTVTTKVEYKTESYSTGLDWFIFWGLVFFLLLAGIIIGVTIG